VRNASPHFASQSICVHSRLARWVGAIALVIAPACDPKAVSINSGAADAASLLDASEPDNTAGTSAGGGGSMGDATVPSGGGGTTSALTDAGDAEAGGTLDAADGSDASEWPFDYCRGLDEQTCTQDPNCSVTMGLRFYSDQGCSREEFAGCRSGEEPCTADIAFALDPDGKCWRLGSSSCMPDDFDRVASGQCMPDAGMCP
jgi:hypothetical protein